MVQQSHMHALPGAVVADRLGQPALIPRRDDSARASATISLYASQPALARALHDQRQPVAGGDFG
jgi:hypothetical protein